MYSVEPPEVIDPCDLKYPGHGYRVDNLEMPEPILSSEGPNVTSKGGDNTDGILKSSPDKTSTYRVIEMLQGVGLLY